MHKKLNRKLEKGIVLISIIIVTIVISILVIGILSTNVSEVLVNQKQIDRIKAEQLAKGIFWVNYTNIYEGNPVQNPGSVSLDGKQFTAYMTPGGAPGSGPNGTQPYIINVNY
jgi:predicted PurR-regulated permease PerM